MTGPWAKFRRAEIHSDEFDRVLLGHLETKPYSITRHFDAESGWNEFRWKVAPDARPPSEDLALIFGDILSNLRASLDYLVWQLVCLAGERRRERTRFRS